jgi:hypothetical protein
VRLLLRTNAVSEIRKKVPDPGGLGAARAAALPRSAFAKFVLGGA